MNERPDFIGLYLETAVEHCNRLGLAVDISITRPIMEKGNISSNRLRVVRHEFVSGKEVLTAVFEQIKKGG